MDDPGIQCTLMEDGSVDGLKSVGCKNEISATRALSAGKLSERKM